MQCSLLRAITHLIRQCEQQKQSMWKVRPLAFMTCSNDWICLSHAEHCPVGPKSLPNETIA